MSKEIKKYTIATFSYRDGRFRKIKSRDEGIRLIDWVRENSPVDLHTLAVLTEQALALLSGRETAGQDEMRGFVSPFIFIVNREGELRLLDLTDESNRAIARKAQSDGVGQFFSPPDKSACTREQAEVFGLGRTCQFILAAGEEAGEPVRGALKKRWMRFAAVCTGQGRREIPDLEGAADALEPVLKKTGKKAGDSPRRSSWKAFLAVAAVLAAVFLIKKTVYDTIPVRQQAKAERAQIARQIDQLEQEVGVLREDQQRLHAMLEN